MALTQAQIDAVRYNLTTAAQYGVGYSNAIDQFPTDAELTAMVTGVMTDIPENIMLSFPVISRVYIRAFITYDGDTPVNTWRYWEYVRSNDNYQLVSNDSITTGQTSAQLNTLYPNALLGFTVIAKNASASGMEYRKISNTEWGETPITIA